ncbi:MAG: MMPL family transporter [Solobacterium sp.]|nr:MMPL family transporter [Solobacterium sp.]MBQ1356651.1 MMPL family transporter [Solobacterium sp.]
MPEKLGQWVIRFRKAILILAVALLIPSGLGYLHTKVNYDLLTYLPKDIETMQGQDILKEEFGSGAFSVLMTEGMSARDTAAVKEKIMQVDHVKNVIWYDSVLDLSVPMEFLPDDVYDAFNSGDATIMFIIFDDTTSADGTIAAVREIRRIAGEQVYLSGMSAVLVDTEDLSEAEAPVYVMMAVALSCVVLMLAMDSFLVPFLFLAGIGMAIVYNLGTNMFLGQISYVTKALAAVLQLGVTMDYSIFLWHSYEAHLEAGKDKEEAMVQAIAETFTSIIGSSVTTVAGFIALCFMSFTLGRDMGIVMAKGVVLGVVGCVTILPAMILACGGLLQKTRHKAVIPDLGRVGPTVTKHAYAFLALALVLLGPAVYGYTHGNIYYNLDSTLPRDLPGIAANTMVKEKFDMTCTHILLLDADVPAREVRAMADEMKQEDGVKWVLGLNTIKGPAIPDEMIPDDLRKDLITDDWQLILIGSEYDVASDKVNAQVEKLDAIADKYDSGSMLIGEAPCTKDLIRVTDHDFSTVSVVSIGIIFIIIAAVFRSLSLPVILVAVIEFGIMVNMGIPAFTGTRMPFVASIIIGTIQLGSTVDYAILLTTRYRRERTAGKDKRTAVTDAVAASAKSILVSALSFFAATFGVGLYSNIDMISSLCVLMARGALISMVCVIFLLPSLLLIFDGIIGRTTLAQKG